MDKNNANRFIGAFGAIFDFEGVAREIISFMKTDPNREYKVIIGTDSLLYDKTKADFVTAIVVHRIGNGGRYFWRKIDLEDFHTLRSRITREVMMSLDTAKDILELLRRSDVPDFGFEIHVDVGEKGETKVLIQELLGMIRAHNFEARTKPDSYAASSVADRHVS